MADRHDREDWRRERSLLALGQAMRGSDEAPPEPAPRPRADAPDERQWTPLIDPLKVLGGIARSKWLILAATLAGAALGVAIALSTPKKYEAVTELIVDPRELKLTDRDLTQDMYAADATLAIVENQMRVLTSRAVLDKVIQKLDLAHDPEFNGEGGSGGLGLMSRVRALLGGNAASSGDGESRRWARAATHLAEALSIERSSKTFVISIGVKTEEGEKSALIANTMSEVFLQTYGDIQADTAGRATQELTARLAELRKGVEEAERKAEEFRAAHDLIDAQGHLISDDELVKLNDQLSVARARTLELKARAASAGSASLDAVLGGALPEELSSNTMVQLRTQYAALRAEADRAAVRLGPRHPERRALDAQVAGARERIGAELRRIASSLTVDRDRAVRLEQELSARLAQLKVRSGDVAGDLVTLRELQREANAKRSVYESFLVRAKETGERKDINTANISVISRAYAPLSANGPSRAMMALAGTLLGFLSGIGLGAVRGAYDSLRETAAARARPHRAARATEAAAVSAPPSSAPPSQPQPQRSQPQQSRQEPWPPHRPARQAAPAPAAAAQAPSIDTIRAELREFGEAVRDLADSRARRRYF